MDLRFTESGFEEKLKGFTCHVQGCGKEYDRACELGISDFILEFILKRKKKKERKKEPKSYSIHYTTT